MQVHGGSLHGSNSEALYAHLATLWPAGMVLTMQDLRQALKRSSGGAAAVATDNDGAPARAGAAPRCVRTCAGPCSWPLQPLVARRDLWSPRLGLSCRFPKQGLCEGWARTARPQVYAGDQKEGRLLFAACASSPILANVIEGWSKHCRSWKLDSNFRGRDGCGYVCGFSMCVCVCVRGGRVWVVADPRGRHRQQQPSARQRLPVHCHPS